MKFLSFIILIFSFTAFSSQPSRYTELLDYVQPAPDQGDTNTCWFVASTGAMELLLNKHHKIKNPKFNGPYDLSESYVIWQNDFYDPKDPIAHYFESVVRRFNHGEAVHNRSWPFFAWTSEGSVNYSVWNRHPHFETLPRVKFDLKITTEKLFVRGNKWSQRVLKEQDLETLKKSLVNSKSPLLVNYNDDGYWHVVLLVGYDDNLPGDCYEIEADECRPRGAFYVRDSYGPHIELRSYDWFKIKGNAAFIVKTKSKKK